MRYENVSDWYPLIAEVCARCGVPNFAPEIKAEFSSARMVSTIGVAYYWRNLIRLSKPLWPYADEREREETIAHEACHLINHFLHGDDVKAHGKEWKRLMEKAGYPPTRCHHLDTRPARKAREEYLQEKRAACGRR